MGFQRDPLEPLEPEATFLPCWQWLRGSPKLKSIQSPDMSDIKLGGHRSDPIKIKSGYDVKEHKNFETDVKQAQFGQKKVTVKTINSLQGDHA